MRVIIKKFKTIFLGYVITRLPEEIVILKSHNVLPVTVHTFDKKHTQKGVRTSKQ